MRTFTDSQGEVWQAALLAASYGNVALLFSPERGSGIRQQPMAADNLAQAEEQLAAMEDDELRRLLASAPAWDPATGGA